MSYSTSEFKSGLKVLVDNDPCTIIENEFVKPGKGHAFVRTTLRGVQNGVVVDRTFRAGEKVERAIIDKRSMQLLYRDGNDYVFMDSESYEQISIEPQTLGEAVKYLAEQSEAQMLMFGSEIVGVELPAAVELEISQTEPGVQGDRVSGARKPATLETGLVVQVPLFVEPNEKVKVDTRTGEYLSRV